MAAEAFEVEVFATTMARQTAESRRMITKK